jgi:hypothetical protein
MALSLQESTGGTLMMAAAVDPENQIVPIAYALAEEENNES